MYAGLTKASHISKGIKCRSGHEEREVDVLCTCIQTLYMYARILTEVLRAVTALLYGEGKEGFDLRWLTFLYCLYFQNKDIAWNSFRNKNEAVIENYL